MNHTARDQRLWQQADRDMYTGNSAYRCGKQCSGHCHVSIEEWGWMRQEVVHIRAGRCCEWCGAPEASMQGGREVVLTVITTDGREDHASPCRMAALCQSCLAVFVNEQKRQRMAEKAAIKERAKQLSLI